MQSHAAFMICSLIKSEVFEILPHSSTLPMLPPTLPRELFIPDDDEIYSLQSQATLLSAKPIKGGRPSKRDKVKRSKDALSILTRHMEQHANSDPAFPISFDSELDANKSIDPSNSRATYRSSKANLLEAIDDAPLDTGREEPGIAYAALMEANRKILTRLREIDEMAAEKGLEIGGEGGDRTGLVRVERAVAQREEAVFPSQECFRGGLLSLTEGAGLPDNLQH